MSLGLKLTSNLRGDRTVQEGIEKLATGQASDWGTRRIAIWAVAVLATAALLVVGAKWLGNTTAAEMPPWRVPGAALAVFLAALVCEYVDSSLGMGYGTVLTPILLLVGFDPLQVVPCVLLSELFTGLAASWMHQRDGNVDFRRDRLARKTATIFCVLSAVGTLAGVLLAVKIPKAWLSPLIAFIVLGAGLATLATIGRRVRYRLGSIVGVGTLAAFNKAVSGGGYGPLVTSGQVVSGVSPKQAVAITSLAESVTCGIGLIGYLLLGQQVAFTVAVPMVLGALLSVPMATLTVRRLPENVMRAGVGVATCFLAGLTLAKCIF